mgnify:CR=1 FL=1
MCESCEETLGILSRRKEQSKKALARKARTLRFAWFKTPFVDKLPHKNDKSGHILDNGHL